MEIHLLDLTTYLFTAMRCLLLFYSVIFTYEMDGKETNFNLCFRTVLLAIENGAS